MNNWYYILVIVGIITVLFAIYKVFGTNKIKNWLLWACTEAEKIYGGGTGNLKLAYVYDVFINKFPKLQAIVPFEIFSYLVDQALVAMEKMLRNEKIANIVNIEKRGSNE